MFITKLYSSNNLFNIFSKVISCSQILYILFSISFILLRLHWIKLFISKVASQWDGIYKFPSNVLKNSKVLRYSWTSYIKNKWYLLIVSSLNKESAKKFQAYQKSVLLN